jgi:hypothetical protein
MTRTDEEMKKKPKWGWSSRLERIRPNEREAGRKPIKCRTRQDRPTALILLPSLTDARADAALAKSILVKAKLYCTNSSINICPTKLLQNVVKHHAHLSPHFAITILKSIDSKTDVLNTKSR